MNLELHATPSEVMRAVEALEHFGEEHGVPGRILFGLALALEECGSNIVNHGLHGDAGKTFRVTFEQSGGEVVIELRDGGPAFDPTQTPSREPAEGDDDRAPGGWGIHLVRRYTDGIRYRRERGENVLRLSKKIDKQAE